jgi:hypothetical protein
VLTLTTAVMISNSGRTQMSLEERLAELTDAVTKNNELLTILTSKARASTEVEAPKSKAKSEDSGETEAPKRRGRPPKKDKVPSAADMKKAAQAYLDEATDDDDYKARRQLIKEIVNKFDAPKFTEIPEEHRAEALAMLNEDQSDGDGEEDDVV